MTAAWCGRSHDASWRRTASPLPKPLTASRRWKHLRAEYGPDKPPVVFCTTETDMSAIELAITNGAQEYIMKPFDEEILVGKFEQVGLL
jgi:PleD family two-component response regulator